MNPRQSVLPRTPLIPQPSCGANRSLDHKPAAVGGLRKILSYQRLRALELPFGAVPLAYPLASSFSLEFDLAMPDVTFIQRGRFGRIIFTLRESSLEISAHTVFGRSEEEFFIGTISPDYDRVGPRFPSFVIFPLVCAVIFGWLTYLVFAQDTLPWPLFGTYSIMFCGTSLWVALCHSRRLDTYVFFDRSRTPKFGIIREKTQAAECDDFVRELLDRIERVDQGLPLPKHNTGSVAARPSAIHYNRVPRSPPRREVIWMVALITGSVGAAFPPASEIWPIVQPYSFVAVYGSLVAAMLTSAYSFTAKERLKYVSILGVGLAATPLFLY